MWGAFVPGDYTAAAEIIGRVLHEHHGSIPVDPVEQQLAIRSLTPELNEAGVFIEYSEDGMVGISLDLRTVESCD